MAKRAGTVNLPDSVYAFLRVVQRHYPLQAAYVFGSYACHTASPESDIDLALISESFSGDRLVDNAAVARLTWGIDTRIEPIALRPKALLDDTPLTAAIRSEGVPVPLTS